MADMPKTVGRYEIEREIGRGAMGVVYQGLDPEIGRPVAVKLIHLDLLGGSHRAEYLSRFRTEIQAAGRCQHPNIVATYDVGQHEGNPFFVMEFVVGSPLGQILPSGGGGLGLAGAVNVILQLLDALGCAHDLGVIHRDIKPANLLLTPLGRLKVMDFGISRLSDARATMTGMVLGTPMYMSPEQLRGGEVDARSDLFATGAVFHELLFGRPPFSAKSVEEAMVKLLYDELTLPPPTPEAPAPVLAVLAKALAKPPEARFPTAQTMAAALREALATPTANGATIAPPPQSTLAPLGDPALLETIERRLAERIGPMASILIRRARPGASSVGVLCERLAAEIDSAEERRHFLADVRGLISGKARPGSPGGPPSLPLDAAAITQIEAELARYMGPMAKVLVKRALPGATTVAELRERLAGNFEQPAERTAFLTHPPTVRPPS